MNCPICLANAVYASHRRGFLEHHPFTWIGLLPFRCGQCQSRFYRIALRDPRRRIRKGEADLPTDQLRAPRWETRLRAAVTQNLSGQPPVVLEGATENASLDGVHLRLPAALTEGSQVSVSLDGGPARAGTVRWVQPESDGGILHGIRFNAPMQRRAAHARPFLRMRLRRRLRRALIVLIVLGAMALAVSVVVSVMESLRSYDPWKKFYEPKDIDREQYERKRLEAEQKQQRRP